MVVYSPSEKNAYLSFVFTLLIGGSLIVLITTSFGANKAATITTIIGYTGLLVGMLSMVSYAISNDAINIKQNITFLVLCAILIMLIIVNLMLFSKFMKEISFGVVPYLSSFIFLATVLLSYGIITTRNFLLVEPFRVMPADGVKVYLVSLASSILLICEYIALKYYITDG